MGAIARGEMPRASSIAPPKKVTRQAPRPREALDRRVGMRSIGSMLSRLRLAHVGLPLLAMFLGVSSVAVGCGSEGATFDTSGGDKDAGSSGSSGGVFGERDGSGGGGDDDDDGGACETGESAAELEPIYLGVAYDVSGSMGQMDCPNWWHDPVLKWRPVREAVQSFFEDATASNINASLTFFPVKDDGAKCGAAAYSSAIVGMRRLPDVGFATALDAVETESGLPAGGYTYPIAIGGASWRGNTPTRFVVDGVVSQLQSVRTTAPGAKLGLLIITDGLPGGCGDASSLANVVARVTAAKDDGIPTYVIGVNNPTTPPATAPWFQDGEPVWACHEAPPNEDDWRFGYDNPDAPATVITNLANLNQIAAAGGTTSAFLIDTGNPGDTKTAFKGAIDDIRRRSVSCEIRRPDPPPGQTFDPEKVNVRYDSGANKTPLGFDPTCTAEKSWRYRGDGNDLIELCPNTCQTVQNDPQAAISVEFGCVRRAAGVN